ncbi:MAG: glutathione S-transferase, partial [Lutimaribacter sp.]
MSTLRLHYAPDNASLIIRLALEELRLPYTTCLVDRARTAQKAP